MRAVVWARPRIIFFSDAYHAVFLEHLEVAGEIAVGQSAKPFQLDKAEALRVGDE